MEILETLRWGVDAMIRKQVSRPIRVMATAIRN